MKATAYTRDFLRITYNSLINDEKRHNHVAYAFECVCAMKYGGFRWSDINPDIKEILRVPASDYGIDVLSATHNDEITEIVKAYNKDEKDIPIFNQWLTAVQAKWYEKTKRVSYKHLSTFACLGRAVLNIPDLIVTTNPGTTINEQILHIPKLRHDIISRDEWDEIMGDMELPPETENMALGATNYKQLKKYLWKPQKTAIKIISKTLKDFDEAIISMACGTGKSYVIKAFIARTIPYGWKSIIVVPTLVLLHQMKDVMNSLTDSIALIGTNHTKKYLSNISTYDIIIVVYNSAHKLHDTIKNGDEYYLYVDEAHHINVPEIYEDCDISTISDEPRNFSSDIFDIPHHKRILFSATIDNSDYVYNQRDAINNGDICDYDIEIPVFDDEVDNDLLAEHIAKSSSYQKILCYCNRVKSAKKFTKLLSKHGCPAKTFDGTTSMKKRAHIMEQFRAGSYRALVTVNVISEGMDIPAVDTCVFVETRGSRVSIIQCIGRTLRKDTTKLLAHVVIPSVNVEKEMRRFLRALASYDPQVRKSIMKKQPGRIRGIDLKKDKIGGELIDIIIFEKVGSSGLDMADLWDYKYKILKKHGKTPKISEIISGIKLGSWVYNNRTNYKKGKLSKDRIDKLESLPYWSWGKTRDVLIPWNKKYEILKKYGKIPKQSEIISGLKLGNWVGHNRTNYKKGKLSKDRIEKFESLSYWSWGKITDKKSLIPWDDKYEILKKYGKIPKISEIISGIKLGNWVHDNRKNYKKEKLSKEKINKLNLLSYWLWGKITDKKSLIPWDDKYEILKKYGEMPKRSEIISGVRLGVWVDNNRHNYKKGKLSKDRIEKFESLIFWKWLGR